MTGGTYGGPHGFTYGGENGATYGTDSILVPVWAQVTLALINRTPDVLPAETGKFVNSLARIAAEHLAELLKSISESIVDALIAILSL